MQRIKKSLQEKLTLISKIKNNLKIKKCDIKKLSEKNKLQFPTIQKLQLAKQDNYEIRGDKIKQKQPRNPETQFIAWINIKRLGRNNEQHQTTPKIDSKSARNSESDNILISTYTSRFAGKNGLMKLVQSRALGKQGDSKNLTNQYLRRTFLQKSSRIFSPERNKVKIKSPQRDENFYGKINDTNHISGIRFKTLDPRFGGITKDELKLKLKKRQFLQNNFSSMNQSPIKLSQRVSQLTNNLYEINLSYNKDRTRHSSFTRYNFVSEEMNNNNKESRHANRRQSHSKDLYSPWDQSLESEQVVWEEFPKIK